MTKPKGLTSVLRNMVSYRPEICQVKVMKVSDPDLSPAHLTQYLRPRPHVSAFILKDKIGQLRLF